MRKFIHLVLLAKTFSTCFYAQAQYVYSDTISLNLTISPHQKDSMYMELKEKGFPESTIQDIIESMSRHTNLQLIKERSVIVRNDTSFVELNYFNTETETFNLKGDRFIMVNGKLVTGNASKTDWEAARVPDSTMTFVPTGSSRNILGIDCVEYVSLDHVFTVWVDPTFKQAVNPGIINKNLPGAIMGFHARKDKSFTRSVLVKMPVQ
jgi:hypothetical protein